jgi:hypothetical protein
MQETTQQRQTEPAGQPHFSTFEHVLGLFYPIGRHNAAKLITEDPRFPQPILGGGSGSRRIYSTPAVLEYIAQVQRTGFQSRGAK